MTRRELPCLPYRCCCEFHICIEDVDAESLDRRIGVRWHARLIDRPGPYLSFSGEYLVAARRRSLCDPRLPPDVHIRELLSHIQPAAATIRELVETGAEATLWLALIGSACFDRVDLHGEDLQLLAYMKARFAFQCFADDEWGLRVPVC